jgi:hypothetical protein
MCRIDAGVAAHLLVHDEIDTAGLVFNLGKPALEAQELHAAALPAVRPKHRSAAGDRSISSA